MSASRVIARNGVPAYRYDAYLCFADAPADRQALQVRVLPRLTAAGLVLAVRYEIENIGAFQLVDVERVVEESKYTVILLSPAYLQDPVAQFTDVLVQTLSVTERSLRLKPVILAPVRADEIPPRLRVYVTRDLTRPERFESEIARLIESLARPLPNRSSGK